jgi:photosystem II stability/assembly factor-like uncharacterized protein
MLIRPDDPDVVYVSSGIFDREAYNSDCTQDLDANPSARGGIGVVRLEKNGANWDATVFTATHGLTDLYVGSLVMHPITPTILMAGAGNLVCSTTAYGNFTGGVFLTTDGGLSWTQTLTGLVVTSVEFAPSNPLIAYAGDDTRFYASDDGGWTWTKVAGDLSSPWGPPGIGAGFPIDILVDPDDPNTLFVNNYGGGNVKSTDGGKTWELASQGYTGAGVFDIDVVPGQPGSILVAGGNSVFRSADGGSTWAGLTYSSVNLGGTVAAAVKPDEPQVILSGAGADPWIYHSTDGGYSWTKVYTDTGLNGLRSVEFSPSDLDVVYAGMCDSVWYRAVEGVGTGTGIQRSVDGGVTWAEANDSQTADECIYDLAIHPTYANIVYAATPREGLYKTADGGDDWTPLAGLVITNVRAIAIHPTNPDIVYAGTGGHGVYQSLDGGSTWTPLVAGMEPNDFIWALEIDPSDPNVVYAGSYFTGVYRWDVTESMWTHMNAGLRTRAVLELAISDDGQVLYAGTLGEGVFRLGDVPTFSVYLPVVLRNH